MRVAILTHEYAPFHGGVGRYVAEISRAAALLGHEVTIHAPDYRNRALHSEEANGSRISRFSGGVFHVKRDFFRYARAVRRFLLAEPSDVVHIADWPAILVCGWDRGVRRLLHQRRVVVTLYGTDVLILAQRRLTASIARRTFQLSARRAAISSYTAAAYAQRFPEAPAASVVHLGVSPFWCRPHLAEFDRPDARLPVVSVGRVVPDKGHAAVIQAIAQLPDHLRRRIEYHVVGSGPESYAAQLVTLARSRQVQLLLRGRLSDEEVARLYQVSWLHVLASRQHKSRVEGFGLVVLEAALAGVPSIATRVGGITELIRHGETGFLVDQDDVNHMSTIMHQLLDDPGLRRTVGATAATAAARFTWERTAELTYGPNTSLG